MASTWHIPFFTPNVAFCSTLIAFFHLSQARGPNCAAAADQQYLGHHLHSFSPFILSQLHLPSSTCHRHADLIVPWQRSSNIVAIDLITEHIRGKLQQHQLKRQYPNLEVCASTSRCGGYRMCGWENPQTWRCVGVGQGFGPFSNLEMCVGTAVDGR